MIDDPLSQVLILLAAAVIVVAAAGRLGLPAILGYLVVGTLLGPFAAGVVSDSATTRLLAELGVVFLLFTLGLEFSWPRMVAARREVFGIGAAQVALTATAVAAIASASRCSNSRWALWAARRCFHRCRLARTAGIFSLSPHSLDN